MEDVIDKAVQPDKRGHLMDLALGGKKLSGSLFTHGKKGQWGYGMVK